MKHSTACGRVGTGGAGKCPQALGFPCALGNTRPREDVLAVPSCLLGTCISSFKQNGVHGMSLGGHFLLTGRRSPVGEALNSHGGSLPRSGACRGTGWVKGAREQGEVLILFFSVKKETV